MLISSSTNEERKATVSVPPKHNRYRGLGGRTNRGTDGSAARQASGGTRPRAARPGRPCARPFGSCVVLARWGFLPDTSRRCLCACMDNNRIGAALTAQLETGTACSGTRTYGSRLTGVASVIRGSTGGVTSELANNNRRK